MTPKDSEPSGYSEYSEDADDSEERAYQRARQACLDRLRSASQEVYTRLPYLREPAQVMRIKLSEHRESERGEPHWADSGDDSSPAQHRDRLRRPVSDHSGLTVTVDFVRESERDDLVWLIAHEHIHLVWRHAQRGRGRDDKLWELASDHEVNDILIKANFAAPRGAVYIPELSGKSAESVYQILQQDSQLMKRCMRQRAQGRGASQHRWGDERKDLEAQCQRASDEADQASEVGDGVGMTTAQAKRAQRLREERGQRSARHHHDARYGSSTHTTPLNITGEAHHHLKRDWRSIIARYVRRRGSRYSSTRYRRRDIPNGVYSPSMRGKVPRLVIALDTSGSTIDLLPQFLREIEHILNACPRFSLKLIQCSAQISSVHDVDHHRRYEISRLSLEGGGGTRFQPVFDHIERERCYPDLLIYLTDGCGPEVDQAPIYPVIWLLSEGSAPAQFGMSLSLEGVS